MSFLEIYGITFLVILGLMTILWLVSLRLRDSSIVDIFWGTGFVVANWVYFALTPDGLFLKWYFALFHHTESMPPHSRRQNFLLKDDSLDFAGYTIQHPLIGNPVISLLTKGRRRPENALIDAAKYLNKTLDELRKTFLKSIEE